MGRILLLLLGIWLSVVSPLWAATTYYISPTGSDASADPTSPATPWKTWAHAIPLLNAGDTLIARNGDYTFAASGNFDANCATTANDGTATQRVTIRAENERMAWIHGNGTNYPFRVRFCDFWTIEGLRVSSADFSVQADFAHPNMWFESTGNLIVRRNVADHDNRYGNNSCYVFNETHDSLIEENEAYYCHRNVMSVGGNGTGNIFRRNYLNSRDYADIPGGRGSNYAPRGDGGFTCYPCSNVLYENNISEGNQGGFEIQANGTTQNITGYGNIGLQNRQGVLLQARGSTATTMPTNVQFFHYVGVNNEVAGFYSRGAKNTSSTIRHCTNCTSVSSVQGFLADKTTTWPGDGTNNFYLTNTLVLNNSSFGYHVVTTDTPVWNINFPHADANGTDYSPASTNANIVNEFTPLSTDPQYGTCYLWPPDGSPMINAGVGGNTNIGATILYRYSNGTLTGDPLWDTTTGAFPCGAEIDNTQPPHNATPALNTTTDGCTTVHVRLNVNTGGCSFPAGYASAALPVVTIAANDATASEEGPDNGQFTITRAGSTVGALDVSFTLVGTATSTVDYTSGNTTLRTIPDGSATQTITIVPIADTEVEVGGETVSVQLVGGSGYTLGTPDNAILTIADGILAYPRVLSGMIAN